MATGPCGYGRYDDDPEVGGVRKMQVWKYHLNHMERNTISVPQGAQLLTVQMQNDEPMLWALVDPDAPLVERRLRTVGTGFDAEEPGPYVGTFQVGPYVFHVFDEGETRP